MVEQVQERTNCGPGAQLAVNQWVISSSLISGATYIRPPDMFNKG